MKRARHQMYGSDPDDEEPPSKKQKKEISVFAPALSARTSSSRKIKSSDFYSAFLGNNKNGKRVQGKNRLIEAPAADLLPTKHSQQEKQPHDITLKSYIRIVSPVPFTWFCSDLKNFEKISKETIELRKASSKFSFPSKNETPTEFQQLYSRHAQKRHETPITSYFKRIKENWKESFISAFLHVKNNLTEEVRFYCQFEKYSIVIEPRENEEGDKTLLAIVSPSTKALRWNLQCKEVPYTLPLDKKKGVTYYDSLEPDQVGQANREKYEQSSLTQLVIQGNQYVETFIHVLQERFEEEFLTLTFQIPKIFAAFPFLHATHDALSVLSSGSLTRTVGLDTTTVYRIEMEGVLLPENVAAIRACISSFSSFSDGPCDIILSTIGNTKHFNLPISQNIAEVEGKEKNSFVSKITVSSSELSEFHLEHE